MVSCLCLRHCCKTRWLPLNKPGCEEKLAPVYKIAAMAAQKEPPNHLLRFILSAICGWSRLRTSMAFVTSAFIRG